ncbi:family 20 glycosylhydrolase [Photobacterium kishitanii]|uniref:family 20 glycosylhydrolase n=2 Tax=Photobacterium kishitanii TaxID=318456 RepID=UPI000D15B444|nr:family 20 glycosylhydrolase [Photobacterium kishitanii]PSW47505.1 beta-hexosaminidase [Photobacterium kishitanii]
MKFKLITLAIILAVPASSYATGNILNNNDLNKPAITQATEPTQQSTLDYIGKNLGINFEVKQNFDKNIDPENSKSNLIVDIALTNNGKFDIPTSDWSIYFGISRNFKNQINNNFSIVKGIGDINTITPTKDLKPIKAGETRIITLKLNDWIVAATDIMPNWYVTSKNLHPVIIESTAGIVDKFVKPFNSATRKRYPQDIISLPTAESRYDIFKNVHLQKLNDFAITPTPKSVSPLSGTTTIDSSWAIAYSPQNKQQAQSLQQALKDQLLKNQIPTLVNVSKAPNTKVIHLVNQDLGKEAYKLDIEDNNITLTGENTGLFYAQTSLISLINQHGNTLPNVKIQDQPRKHYRGFMLDVARNFHSKEAVLRLLDQMAAYKMNVFHFHLSDDENWRLEIPSLPELTEIGATRCHDISETKCLMPMLGSGPEIKTQFYTVEDYKEILQYAQNRHIQIMPEFDVPGHSRAAMIAMESRYNRLKAKGKNKEAEQFRLIDPLDQTKYQSVQHYPDNAINVCIPSTYNFMEELVTQVETLHKGIQPLKDIHLGGDEIAGAWVDSPACKTLIANTPELNNINQLGEYFFNCVNGIATEHNLDMHGWGDAFIHDNQTIKMKGKLTAQVWNTVWEWQSGGRANMLANANYDVVLSNAPFLYFDHPQAPDPQERGYYWSTRYTNTEKVFGFSPANIYNNIDIYQSGKKIPDVDVKNGTLGNLPSLKANAKDHILGIEAALWSETARTDDQMEYMIYPRIIAAAERAWYEANWEKIADKNLRNQAKHQGWVEFANRIGQKELPKMDKYHDHGKDIQYRLPMVGAKIVDGKMVANTAYPGVNIQYSTNGGKSWSNYTAPVKITGTNTVQLRTISKAQRVGRETTLTIA